MWCSSRFMLGAAFKLDNVTHVTDSELEKLKEWLQGNKLFLNIEKTTSVIIGTKRMLTDEKRKTVAYLYS